ncbi:MAG TPA: hypothetical protein VN947_10310 [Polyangia bacterium]|nr:hypothetical protein [Polyangia bacterium]
MRKVTAAYTGVVRGFLDKRFFVLAAVLVAACGSSTNRGDMGGGGDLGVGLTILPSTIELGPGRTQQFAASRRAQWSVVEAGGGSVDDHGLYTAPATVGDYHLSASTDDGLQARATITVVERKVALLAGALGADGTADDSGTSARFATPEHLAYDGAGTLYVADYDNHTVRAVALPSGAVTTVAGLAGAGGAADGTGTNAIFHHPWGVALDGKGALLVSDSDNNTIRRIELGTRAVTTISGIAGQTGNTNGTAALWSGPLGLAYDGASGTLYVADSGNGAVRALDVASRSVRTIAGGFGDPVGLAFDGGSYLYVADRAQQKIVRVTVADGTEVTLAGGGYGYRDGTGTGAHFSFLGQVALAGNTLYIADLGLRALDVTTGAVTTLARASDDLAGGGGLALDGQGHLFVSLLISSAILRVNLDGSGRTVVAGPPAFAGGYFDGIGAGVRFDQPRSLVFDGAGALYVSDAYNSAVRQVDVASGSVQTLAGTPWRFDRNGSGAHARFNSPERVLTDGAGTLYIVEPANDVVRKYVVATGALTTLAGTFGYGGNIDGSGAGAQLNLPAGGCVMGGALYLADAGNDTIRKIDLATAAVTTIAGAVELADGVDDTGAAARFDTPRDVACDATNNLLYVADANNHALRRVDLASGAVTTVAGALKMAGDVDDTAGAARFTSPSYLAAAGGFLYVGEPGSKRIRKVSLADFSVTTPVAALPGSMGLTGLTVDGAGTVYYSDRDALVHAVSTAGVVTTLAGGATAGPTLDGTGGAASFDEPSGLTLDGGSLYLVEPNGATLRAVTLPGGAVTTIAGCGTFCAQFAGTGAGAFFSIPYGLAFDGAGALFATDLSGHTLDRIGVPGAALTVVAGVPLAFGADDGIGAAARLDAPGSIVSDGAGTIYMSDRNDHVIRSFVVATGALSTIAGQVGTRGTDDGPAANARFSAPEGLALDGAGNLYIADSGNHAIRRLALDAATVDTLAGMPGSGGALDGIGHEARFVTPLDLAYDGAGHLYVADSGNGAIRRIEIASATVTTYAGVLGQHGVAVGAIPGRLNRPSGLAVLPDGGLAILDEQAVLVVR